MLDKTQPLWLPKGSVRAILSFLVVVPIAVILLRSNVVLSADQAIGLASLVLAAYFVQKAARAGD